LRQEISRLYTSIQPDDILVHSGAEEVIFLFMHAALQPGDHMIFPKPCYQSLEEVARSIGCEATPWELRDENDWQLNPDDLKALIRPNTRVLVINNPHNPTGYIMPREVFEEVNRIAQEAGIILFSDEVYRESEHHPEDRLPSACDVNPSAVALGVMSKTYGLAGLRIGWIATHHRGIYEKMMVLKDYTTICNSAPSELLAEIALRHREQIASRNLFIIQHNLELLDEFFSRHDATFSWKHPKAGSIAFPRLLQGEIDVFCDRLLHRAGVMIIPGTLFGDTQNHFRVGFGRKNFPEGLQMMDSFLSGQ
jgi:aspartate/methionine/tyrosine aminotransferase